MTATAHALIGASIAAKVTNPYLGIPLAILSHLILDLIPHWDAGTNHREKSIMRLRAEAAIDVIVGFFLVFLIFRNIVPNPVYLYSMVIAAQLPDWLETPASMFNIKIPPFSWMNWVGHNLQSRMQLPWGLITQVVVVGFVLFFVVYSADIGKVLAASIP